VGDTRRRRSIGLLGSSVLPLALALVAALVSVRL
jgi:hypothetical protein